MGKEREDQTEVKRHNPRFFKVLTGDFVKSLKIPPKFHKHLRNQTESRPSSSNPSPIHIATLLGPTGKTHHVQILKTQKFMFFTSGWTRFAMDHSLKEHEMLIFQYNGSMQFEVFIFDKTACEKQFLCGNEDVNELCFDIEPVEIDSSDEDTEPIDSGEDKSDEESTEPIEMDSSEDKSDEEYNEESVRKNNSKSECKKGSRSRRPVISEMEKNAQKAADSFSSENPFFVIHLSPCHINCSSKLRFPREFSSKYLPKAKCEFILRVSNNDKAWEVNYIPSVKERDRLCKGWVLFARENLLKADDFCAFELINSTEFLVHIFRVSDFGENEDLNISFDKGLIETDSRQDKPDEEYNGELVFKKDSKSKCMKGIKRRHSIVTEMEIENTQKAANSFVSENPFFIIHLKPSHVYNCSKLRLPTEFSRKYLPKTKCEFILKVSNSNEDKIWEANYIPNWKDRDTLCKGWPRFVRENLLEAYDSCAFELISLTEFLVHVFRVSDIGEDKERNECFDKRLTDMDSSEEDKLDEEYNEEAVFEETSKSKCQKGIKRKHPVAIEMQKGKAQKAASSFVSENPFFIVQLTPSHVYSSSKLRFPAEFSNKYLPKTKCEFILRVVNNDKTWEVNYNPSVKERDKLCKGWVLFVRENSLKPDDFCAFELVKEKEFRVHIFSSEERNECFYIGSVETDSCLDEEDNVLIEKNSLEDKSHEVYDEESVRNETSKSKCMKGIKRRRPVVTEMEMKKTQKAANSFASENPFFIIHLKPSHVSSCSKLRLPTEFSKKILPTTKCEFILRVSNSNDDKKWETNYIPSWKERDKLCKGWPRFARENLLEAHDSCAFELINPTEFLVHIFRVSDIGANELGNECFDKGLTNTDSREDKSNDECNEVAVFTETSKSKCQGIKRRRPVGTEIEKEKAQKAANSFVSENPFFRIQLTPSHVYSCSKLRFPAEFSNKHLPKTKCEFILRVVNSDKAWGVNYNPSVKERDRLCKGWPLFVRENSLEADDFCAFELVKEKEFRIHIFRVIDHVCILWDEIICK